MSLTFVRVLRGPMGVNHGGTRGTSPPRIWSEGTLMQIVPSDFVMFQYLAHTRSLALKCSKKLTNPMTNRVFIISQNTSSTSTKSPLQAENSTFLARTRTKILLRMHQNTTFQVKKNQFFSGMGPSPLPRTLPRWGKVPLQPLAPSLLDPPIRPPRILARFTPLGGPHPIHQVIGHSPSHRLVFRKLSLDRHKTASLAAADNRLCNRCSPLIDISLSLRPRRLRLARYRRLWRFTALRTSLSLCVRRRWDRCRHFFGNFVLTSLVTYCCVGARRNFRGRAGVMASAGFWAEPPAGFRLPRHNSWSGGESPLKLKAMKHLYQGRTQEGADGAKAPPEIPR